MPATNQVSSKHLIAPSVPLLRGVGRGATNQVSSKHLIAQGGFGSDLNDDFLTYAKRIGGTNTTALPLRGTGLGLGGTGVNRATELLTNAINRKLESKIPVHVAGHSLGAVLAHKIKPMYATNPNVSFSLIDPPYGGWWQDAPGYNVSPGMIPFVRGVPNVIKEQAEKGISIDPDIIDWTKGRTATGARPEHSPWTNPEYGSNQQNLNALTTVLKRSLLRPYQDYTNRNIMIPTTLDGKITVR